MVKFRAMGDGTYLGELDTSKEAQNCIREDKKAMDVYDGSLPVPVAYIMDEYANIDGQFNRSKKESK